MNTVRSCFAATVTFLVVAIGRSAADAEVCCNSSLVASGGGAVASCLNENRTFHTVEAIGGGTCDDNRTAVPVRKCCPPGQPYDPDVRFCGPAGADGDGYLRRMMERLREGFRAVADATMVGYDYEQPKCDDTQVLVDVPAAEVRELMEADPSAVELPPGHCFDLTSSNQLVARACRPRHQYCGRGNYYTCVNKCCRRDRMIVVGEDGENCKQSEKPFTMPAYETDADGRPSNQSNSTVLPYYLLVDCLRIQVTGGFKLTTNGSLYLNGKGQHVPNTEYCVEYYAKAGPLVDADLQAFVCAGDEPQSSAEDTRGSWRYIINLAGLLPSVVCLALTLLVYAALPSLRNVHGYYVMCYVACLLVSFISLLILQWAQEAMGAHLCVLSGYFTLFSFLTSFCWLNVICFDIYWMLRYNNSINRRSTISVRTIMYHIYCWGFSIICVCTGYLFQHSQNETLLNLAPDIGYRSCWFFKPTSYGILIFFLIPVSVMLTANLIMFLLTAIHCSRIKSDLNKFKRTDDSKIQRFIVDKEKFVMCIKLFMVMGITWSFEMVSKFYKNEEWIILWVIFDEINALQGVMIFSIFVAKSKVIMNLRKKLRGSTYHSESTKMTTTSGLSQSGTVNKSYNDF